MTEKISRRDFLKLAGVGSAAAAVLTGCGPASRYVVREPYTTMPEYTYNGQSTYYSTTCRECPVGCGIIVRTMQGRALKVEGNPHHPVNQGKTCSRAQAAPQGLYNPDRIENPVRHKRDDQTFTDTITWEEALPVVQQALTNDPGGIAFMLGLTPDHLFDLVSQITASLGAPAPVRYGAHQIFDARDTLMQAAASLFGGDPFLPYFDLGQADVVFSFGAHFLDTYLSPVAYSREYARFRKGQNGQRGYLVQFEPALSSTGGSADTWVPIMPGSEALVAQALGSLVAEARGVTVPAAFANVDVAAAAQASGVDLALLQQLAGIFSRSPRPMAIPGGAALAHTNGLEAGQIILSLNALVGNIGAEGGVFQVTPLPAGPQAPESASQASALTQVNDLINRMEAGQVQVLFVQGVNPVFELPKALGFEAALEKVPLVISFSSFPDETAVKADYVLPDHTALESWGYQRVAAGTDRPVLSGAQPVVAPFYNTRATADVFLAAVQGLGGQLAAAVPFKDEVEFIENALLSLVQEAGVYSAPEIRTFMAQFQQYGGWWPAGPALEAPAASALLTQQLSAAASEFAGTGEFFLLPFMSPIMGDGSGANKPWLQELPDPMTTVMWGSWVQINPQTAAQLGLVNDDVVKITSPAGSIEAPVYLYPAIRPDTIAIPFGQGHTAYGRYAQNRGVNPAGLLGLKLNGSGDLAYASNKVTLEKTGKVYKVSRLESKIGVYGEGFKE